jgi:hypothetical protein
MAAVRMVYVDVEEANVPTAAEEENSLKKGREREVMLSDFWLDQVLRAR